MRKNDWSQGTYEHLTIIHEIGHALSLAHAHDGHEMPAVFDDVRYTIMSYNNNDYQSKMDELAIGPLWGLHAHGL